LDSFRWIAVTLAMVLGLGVTRVLSGVVAVFKSRSHAELDWIPLIWAASIFVLQIQFWWAVIELPTLVETWTLNAFLLLLAIPLVLFLAAALVLPSGELDPGESLRDQFGRDGRWGLICLSAYAVLAFAVDIALFDFSMIEPMDAALAMEFVLPLVFLRSRPRRLRAAVTVVYLLIVLVSSWYASPKFY
jgi:hypothetical protein